MTHWQPNAAGDDELTASLAIRRFLLGTVSLFPLAGFPITDENLTIFGTSSTW